jgi:hypothetical protein
MIKRVYYFLRKKTTLKNRYSTRTRVKTCGSLHSTTGETNGIGHTDFVCGLVQAKTWKYDSEKRSMGEETLKASRTATCKNAPTRNEQIFQDECEKEQYY